MTKVLQKRYFNTKFNDTLIHEFKVSISFHVMLLFIDTLIDKFNHTLITLFN